MFAVWLVAARQSGSLLVDRHDGAPDTIYSAYESLRDKAHEAAANVSNIDWSHYKDEASAFANASSTWLKSKWRKVSHAHWDQSQGTFLKACKELRHHKEFIEAELVNLTSNAKLAFDKAMIAYEARKPETGDLRIEWPCAYKVLVGANLVGVGTAVTLSTLLPLFLSILGFSETGVSAGAVAAQWQSTIGNVKAGSLFALLQSISMAGLSGSQTVLIASAAATATTSILTIVCSPSEFVMLS